MQLWGDEIEAMRTEMREATGPIADLLRGGDRPTGSVADRVARQRADLEPLFRPSDHGDDRTIAGVACRVFTPEEGPARAVYLHFHGGGMVIGHPTMNDPTNERLCRTLGVAVVSVDYRLAPEHPWPAGPDDGLAVAAWLIANGADEFGSDRIVVGGESAGGYMAAITLLRVRDELDAVHRVVGANLVYGVHDWGRSPSQRGVRPSATPDVLTPDGIRFFTELFVPDRTDDERRHPSISPAFAALHDLPPALFSVGTADHLLDDTLTLAGRWAAWGNQTELAVYPDAPHGFDMFTDTAMAQAHQRRLTAWFERIVSA